ncbi:SCF ubiquitin ligase complex protein SKP1b [Dimargaris cristalligena]|uniref:E3 ubiquitin ligase complex SCF subunit n=1 Tax=Dimargaris cristalligena TaxID=215637 RepID=A0A4P9ZUL2_9FUNG|nr:SCF ubiquitin ligase complex protein SKP1b [Dimargaris cristalligena]|eukprot:RKP37237.1 SCF ubiquitin ligase complex protein SKP1b [Dimargaris cristalligena]
MIRIRTSEGMELEVEREIMEQSMLIKGLLEDVGHSNAVLPLPNVSGPILAKVIEYCRHHQLHNRRPAGPSGSTPDGTPARQTITLGDWDREFCNVDQGALYELILAANYLDIKPLLDLTCLTVANMIKGKMPDEIRRTFNVKNDFTPEEEEAVRKENEWCEDR